VQGSIAALCPSLLRNAHGGKVFALAMQHRNE
jgi:hypothetical protein